MKINLNIFSDLVCLSSMIFISHKILSFSNKTIFIELFCCFSITMLIMILIKDYIEFHNKNELNKKLKIKKIDISKLPKKKQQLIMKNYENKIVKFIR